METILSLILSSLIIVDALVIVKGFAEITDTTVRECISEDIEYIVDSVKMLFPKYRAQEKLETAYNLLQRNYVSIMNKSNKTTEDEENLQNIEESMALIRPYIPERHDK